MIISILNSPWFAWGNDLLSVLDSLRNQYVIIVYRRLGGIFYMLMRKGGRWLVLCSRKAYYISCASIIISACFWYSNCWPGFHRGWSYCCCCRRCKHNSTKPFIQLIACRWRPPNSSAMYSSRRVSSTQRRPARWTSRHHRAPVILKLSHVISRRSSRHASHLFPVRAFDRQLSINGWWRWFSATLYCHCSRVGAIRGNNPTGCWM
jgi:hypothetical protein